MKITSQTPANWNDLQDKVAEILTQCGFDAGKEQVIESVRGKVEIDVFAEELVKGRKYTILCECKYWKSKIPQAVIHGFRTVVNDIGANIGYIITTSDFQSGAKLSSLNTNVELLSWENFQLLFFESWYETFFSPEIAKRLDALLTYSEPILPKWFDKLSTNEKEEYFALKEKYDSFGWIIMSFTPYPRMLSDKSIQSLPLSENFKLTDLDKQNIPIDIIEETCYLEFLEKSTIFGNEIIAKFRVYSDKYKE